MQGNSVMRDKTSNNVKICKLIYYRSSKVTCREIHVIIKIILLELCYGWSVKFWNLYNSKLAPEKEQYYGIYYQTVYILKWS